MADTVFVAVDLGASSGRHVAGLLNGKRLELVELHRFENTPVVAAGRMHWNLLQLWHEIRRGLRVAGERFGDQVRSVGVDTWGVDFGLLARGDELLANPVHYRDRRTDGMLDLALSTVTRETIFDHTGLQFMPINTLYQVLAMHHERSPILEAAESMLLMADLFHWLLTGVKSNEQTNASTTQFYDPRKRDWSRELFDKLGLPTRILGPITQPGTRLGKLLPEVAADSGLRTTEVVVPATHDTASAVLAVPASGHAEASPDWCYISSGTWSLMGVELASPVVTVDCLAMNFTNEAGVGNTTRLLKNIAGLWLVQECRRIWAREGRSYTWDQLTQMASSAAPLASVIDPDDPSLMAPENMPQAIRALCQKSAQPTPESEGAVIRCALESLAMKYRVVLERLERLAGLTLRTVHVVGGGTQNRQLCQMTANACARPVIAGPVEATAIGNILMQALSAGEIASVEEGRTLIRESFAVETYEPQDRAAWQSAYEQFCSRYGYR